jgi:RNA-directed DNA polymerase
VITDYPRHPLNQSRLYKVKSIAQLSDILGISKSYVKYIMRDRENYIRFTTKGGRDVQWPKPILRRGQKRAAQLLSRIETPDFLHSAKRGRSYITNAQQHSWGHPSVKIDIRQFFQSTRAAAVYHFFADKMCCVPDVASALTKLLTVDGYLPTGGNASPILSYFTYMDMFSEIEILAKQRDCVVTCLIDDMTFTGPGATRALIYDVRRIIARYRLWGHKTKVFKRGQPKIITGVAVTRIGPRVPNKRQVAIAEDLKSLAAAQSDEERLVVLRRVIGRIHEAAQIEPLWRSRADSLVIQRREIERRLRETEANIPANHAGSMTESIEGNDGNVACGGQLFG